MLYKREEGSINVAEVIFCRDIKEVLRTVKIEKSKGRYVEFTNDTVYSFDKKAIGGLDNERHRKFRNKKRSKERDDYYKRTV